MKVTPLVSVVMITYGQENYIRQAVEGVLMQECNFEVELIISNDCSLDNTDAVIRDVLNSHPKSYWIKYILHKENKGMMPNFINALQQCDGKYIALCDGDDYWTDSLKLQRQVDFLEANLDYALCFHPCQFLYHKEEKLILSNQLLRDIKYEYTINNLLSYWGIPTASMVFRNDKCLNFPDWFSNVASGDIALVMMYFEKGKFKLLEEYMSVYRITEDGVSKSHINYRMIYYRAKLYCYLNEYFEHKYEDQIYDALNYIYLQYSQKKIDHKPKRSFFYRLKTKVWKTIGIKSKKK